MTREDAIVWLNTDDYESAGFQKALEMAIKALEQEQQADNEWCTDCKEYDHEKHCCPRFSQVIKTTLQECCENAVSREDVLLMLTGEDLPDDASKLISIFGERIKNLPPVKPQEPRWIPISEALPKVADCYAVTRKIGSDLIVDACFFDGTNTWHNDNRINHERNYLTNIVAWMPLPEPYKAGSEDVE